MILVTILCMLFFGGSIICRAEERNINVGHEKEGFLVIPRNFGESDFISELSSPENAIPRELFEFLVKRCLESVESFVFDGKFSKYPYEEDPGVEMMDSNDKGFLGAVLMLQRDRDGSSKEWDIYNFCVQFLAEKRIEDDISAQVGRNILIMEFSSEKEARSSSSSPSSSFVVQSKEEEVSSSSNPIVYPGFDDETIFSRGILRSMARRRASVQGTHYQTILFSPLFMEPNLNERVRLRKSFETMRNEKEGKKKEGEEKIINEREAGILWRQFEDWNVLKGENSLDPFPYYLPMSSGFLDPEDPRYLPVFMAPAHDFVVGAYVKTLGSYDPAELRILSGLVKSGDCAVEIGSNIGSYTVPLAKKIGIKGRVYAFEPFRDLFHILAGNIALAGLRNVYTRPYALGWKDEFVTVNSPTVMNFTNSGASRVFFQQKSDVAGIPYHGIERIEVKKLDSLLEAEFLCYQGILGEDQRDLMKAWGEEKTTAKKAFIYDSPLDIGNSEHWSAEDIDFNSGLGPPVDSDVVFPPCVGWSRNGCVDLLKIDAEGTEDWVILGAGKTIMRSLPLLYVENQPYFNTPRNTTFVDSLKDKFGYNCVSPAALQRHELLMCVPSLETIQICYGSTEFDPFDHFFDYVDSQKLTDHLGRSAQQLLSMVTERSERVRDLQGL